MLIRSSPDGLLAVGDLQVFLGSSVWLAPPLGSGLGCTLVDCNIVKLDTVDWIHKQPTVGWISKQTLGTPRTIKQVAQKARSRY